MCDVCNQYFYQLLNSQIFLLSELLMMYRTGIEPKRMDPDMVNSCLFLSLFYLMVLKRMSELCLK